MFLYKISFFFRGVCLNLIKRYKRANLILKSIIICYFKLTGDVKFNEKLPCNIHYTNIVHKENILPKVLYLEY